MQFITATISKPGGRKENQDYCHYSMKDQAFCWLVADGLGGHSGGEIASRLAMEYKVYTRSAYPDWPVERIRKIEQSFALCKKTKDFVEREDSCDMWEFRNDPTDFGCL